MSEPTTTELDELREIVARMEADRAAWEAKTAEHNERMNRLNNPASAHPLTRAALGAQKALAEIEAEIEKWTNDRIYSDEVKKQKLADLEGKRAAYIQGGVGGQWVEMARKEIDKLIATKNELITTARLKDPLNNPVSMANGSARLKGIASQARNLAEFEQAYEAAGNDPYLRRAYQTESAQYVRKWGEPAGALLAQLERDYEDSFLSPPERAKLEDSLKSLQEAVRTAQKTNNQFMYKAATGTAYGLYETPAAAAGRELDKISWEVSAHLNDGKHNVHGGFYFDAEGKHAFE